MRSNWRAELVEFYQQHNPAKLSDVDFILQTFRGREAAMMKSLREKYGVAPVAMTDSSNSLCGQGAEAVVAKEQSQASAASPTQEMAALLAHMSAVDLVELSRRLSMDEGGDTAVLLRHTATYLQSFAACARRYLELARDVQPSSSRTASAPRTADCACACVTPTTEAATQTPAAAAAACSTTAVSRSVMTSPIAAHAKETERLPAALDTRSLSPDCSVTELTQPPPPDPKKALSPAPQQQQQQNQHQHQHHEHQPLWAAPRTPLPSTPRGAAASACLFTPIPPSPAGPPPAERALVASSQPPRDSSSLRCWPVHPNPPGTPRGSVLSEAVLRGASSGDAFILHPGVYYENISVTDGRCLELRSAYPGAPVILRAMDDLLPVLLVGGSGTSVTASGIVFVRGDVSPEAPARPAQDLSEPTVPLVKVQGSAQLSMDGCHVYNGSGGGVAAVGMGTVARLRLCLISLCAFAGVFVQSDATMHVVQCRIKKSECGVRVARAARLLLRETTIEDNETDGVVVHDGSSCTMEKCAVFHNKGNGIFLSRGADMSVVSSTVELNAMCGVQRFKGANLYLQHTLVRDNGLLPVSDEGVDAA